jgi:hypothetical protein
MIKEESCAARNIAPVVETPRTLIKCWFLAFVQPSDTMDTPWSPHSFVNRVRAL